MHRLTTIALTAAVALTLTWQAVGSAQADDPPPVAQTTVLCTTERVLRGAHGMARETTCVRVAPVATPTAAQRLEQQADGPPIPGRGGPRWEGDTDDGR